MTCRWTSTPKLPPPQRAVRAYTPAVFGAKLRDAVDSETVVSELAGAATRSVEPAHVSVWIRT